jgi:hypothetical protein
MAISPKFEQEFANGGRKQQSYPKNYAQSSLTNHYE